MCLLPSGAVSVQPELSRETAMTNCGRRLIFGNLLFFLATAIMNALAYQSDWKQAVTSKSILACNNSGCYKLLFSSD